MTKRGKRKIGRNDPCPCQSGLKFKKCHGCSTAPPLGPPPNVLERLINKHQANEAVRESQQGKSKPIIATDFKGYKVTAVGNTIHWSKKHKTFIDFLGDYLHKTLGPEWGNAEIKKPLENRHIVLQWYDLLCAYQRKHKKLPAGEIESTPYTGLIHAYYGLSYNLYLLAHNVELRDHLVKRLKVKDQFYGAYYETCVASWFILAGFQLSLENEEDSTVKHVEFVATKNGKSFTVEAKYRQPGKANLDVGNQLFKALQKPAKHPRIVFIEMNIPEVADPDAFSAEIISSIRGREGNPSFRPNGEEAPPAYVHVTNRPYHLRLDDENIPYACLSIGFKIPDFGHNTLFHSFVEAFKARRRHREVLAVQDAFAKYTIPITFDGEIPEFAFGEAERRFVIGDRHKLDDGKIGTLSSGIVIESEQSAVLVYAMEDGTSAMYKGPLTEAEMRAYQAHPETFFGRVQSVSKNIQEPIEMFEWLHDTYKDTSREKILGWMSKAADIAELATLSDADLRLVYVERLVYGIMQRSKGKNLEEKPKPDQRA